MANKEESTEKLFPYFVNGGSEDKDEYEEVGVNGTIWQIKKGQRHMLPPEVIEALENKRAMAMKAKKYKEDQMKNISEKKKKYGM